MGRWTGIWLDLERADAEVVDLEIVKVVDGEVRYGAGGTLPQGCDVSRSISSGDIGELRGFISGTPHTATWLYSKVFDTERTGS